MAKLYSTIMEQKISSWAEHHHKQALGQAHELNIITNKHLVKQVLDQSIQLLIIRLHQELSWKNIDFKGKCYVVL